MEDNKSINAKIEENADAKKTETTANVASYDPDDYMYEYHDDFYYYDVRCSSCKYWLENDCGALTGACNYEPF